MTTIIPKVLPKEILIEIIQRYRGRLMRLLVVSKWVGRIALDYLVDTISGIQWLDDTILGTPRNVRKLRYRADYDLAALNPMKLIVSDAWIGRSSVGNLTRLTKLVLDVAMTEPILMLTTLTSLSLRGHCEVKSLSSLTRLRRLCVTNDVSIDGLSLETLRIHNSFKYIGCTTLRKLSINDVGAMPELADGVCPAIAQFSFVNIPRAYHRNLSGVQKLSLRNTEFVDGLFSSIQPCKLSLCDIYDPPLDSEICAMTRLQQLSLNDVRVTGYDLCIPKITKLAIRSTSSFIWLCARSICATALVSLTLDVHGDDRMLSRCTTLTSLTIIGVGPDKSSQVTDAAFVTLTRLQRLEIVYNKHITAAGLCHLDHLREIDFNNTSINLDVLYRTIKRRRSLYGVTTINPAKRWLHKVGCA